MMERRSTFGFVLAAILTMALFCRSAMAEPEIHPATLAGNVAFDSSKLLGSPSPLPPYKLEVAFPNLSFDRPIVITHAGDGTNRLFVGTQYGQIFVFDNSKDVKEAKLVIDLRERTKSPKNGGKNEEGLMGMAFHPRFKENGEFFVYYTRKPMHSVVARFRMSKDDPNKADPDFEERLLEQEQPFWNHNAGMIQFGPDGKLYVTFGDGGAANDPHGNGQNLKTLLGSVVRIDVDKQDAGLKYAIPADNPFVGRKDARGEIWAFGVRNPWGLSFDRKTGELWLADVGQNIWEEVNVIKKGGNYGWKVRESNHPFAKDAKRANDEFIDPVWEYHHEYGRSITGGVVYRGKRLSELDGWYLCTDFVSLRFWLLQWDGERVVSSQEIAASKTPISAMGEDAAGEALITAFDGKIYQLARAGQPTTKHPDFPRQLSQTGLFTSTKDLKPAPGLIPYSVNVPLWSDGAGKERYIALPKKNSVRFREKTNWQFPVGTVTVKTFFVEGSQHRIETRLLVNDPEEGWVGYTYRWNDEQTDATLLDASARAIVPAGGDSKKTEWYFPSRQDCMTCHTKAAGFVLGINTRQLNRVHSFGGQRRNQVNVLSELGIFSEFPDQDAESMEAYPQWGSKADSVDRLTRAYLDVNCAMCHAPGGPGNSKIDLRYHTPLDKSFLLEKKKPVRGRRSPQVLTAGDPSKSSLLSRIAMRGPGQMPIVGSRRVHQEAVDLLTRWIRTLPSED